MALNICLLCEVTFFCRTGIKQGILSFQVLLTPTHLAIVMEYAAGGELFERICTAGRFSEDEVEEKFILFKSVVRDL